uniref:Transporter associated with antigen processing, subunit type t, teleost specific n=1 Tax=Acanthochromis polyacanthus TaxID=80966 RepID=A0A3Q1FML0_9TELE
MKDVAACGFYIVLFDAVLCSALWAGRLLMQSSSCGGLAAVWAFGTVKWICLHVFTLLLTEGNPQAVLHRLVALLCLLTPAVESGRFLGSSPSEPYSEPSPDFNMLLLGPAASVLACLVWEKGLCGNGKGKKDSGKLDTGQLLMRTLKLFRPDALYLVAAFGFLILAVICECEKRMLTRSLASRLHLDVDRMGRTVALNANATVRSTVKAGLMFAVMLNLSWELTVLTCIEMPLTAVVQNKYITLAKEKIQDCHAENRDRVSQTISGIRTVRRFKAEEGEVRRYQEAVERMCSLKRRSGIYSVCFGFIRRLLTLSIKILMLVQARSLISSGRLSIGSLVSFFLYQKPMSVNLKILHCYEDTVSTVGVISKVFGYIDRTPKSKKEGELAPETLEGRVVFQNVTFSYPSAPDKPALKSVSMELQPGKMTALVGLSGSGKSSCVSLLKRLYEPQEGRILLDGEPLHRYKHKNLHQKVALVSQNPVLFSGSLKYNIEYGLKGCTTEKIKETAERVKRGGKLSEGQKQCIAVIRALVRDPQVVILDEATSKLDVDAQHAVVQEVLARGRTVLIVAHQLKTVEKADHIIFIEKGVIMEEGTHSELMARRGRYHRLKEELFSQSS